MARVEELLARITYHYEEIERLERDHPGHDVIPLLRKDIADAEEEIGRHEEYLGLA